MNAELLWVATLFTRTLKSDYNTWYSAVNETPFPVGDKNLDFRGWKRYTGQDLHSVFAAPSDDLNTACNAP